MAAAIRIAFISSVIPENSFGGEVLLYRHFSREPALQTIIVDGRSATRSSSSAAYSLLSRLQKSRFSKCVNDAFVLLEGHWLEKKCSLLNSEEIDIVMTVAHGDAFSAARRFANRNRLPLVSIYHDWWPDIPYIHSSFKKKLEKQFRNLAGVSARVLCVSEAMRNTVGNFAKSTVLYPIPDGSLRDAQTPQNVILNKTFRIGYMGNLYDYGKMLQDLIEESWKYPQLKVEVRGKQPDWHICFQSEAKKRENWLEFAQGDELQDWLNSMDAFLVPMDFRPEMRRRMETSFPSKLTEFSRFGKPLIIWGPDYCSAIKWAAAERKALCVSEPPAAYLLSHLVNLIRTPEERMRLAAVARYAATQEFDPERIQRKFSENLNMVTACGSLK